MRRRVKCAAFAGLVCSGACSGDGDTVEPRVDLEPPSVALIADRALVTSAGDVLLTAIASDSDAVVQVEFYEQFLGVDASPRSIHRDSLPPFQFQRHFIATAPDGTYEFTARAHDPSGNVGNSLRASVVVVMAPLNDNTPPTVTATTPVNGAIGVAVDAMVTATFSEALNPLSITSASFTIRPGVTGTVSYEGTTATFIPSTPLALAATYTATISTAVRDLAGNPLPQPYIWTFGTGSASGGVGYREVRPGFFYVCGVKTGGEALCWGQNSDSQLGDGTTTVRLTPAGVLGGLRFTTVTAARQGYHSCGVTEDAYAYCWGSNTYGQLGDGTTSLRRSPVAVLGGLRFTSVSTGRSHSCGLATDSVAYCWGDNQAGQLGDGTTTRRTTPVAVAGGHRFLEISVGAYHTCGVTTANEGYCWGTNGSGELGDGTTTVRTSPVLVGGGRRFATLSAGAGVSCGISDDFAAYCWGDNFSGALGNGTTSATPRTTPVAVVGGHQFLSISAGVSHVCAITVSGNGYCWGSNYAGQLGDGTTTRRTSPVAVVGNLTFQMMRVGDGGGCTCGVTNDGVAYCWGDNQFGQLGTGGTNESTVPVKVMGQP